MTTPPESVGQVIGNYRILMELGHGGMGTVYRAQDVRLDREVALKLLPDESLFNKDSMNRFRREARAASSLNHPHICTVYDAGEADGIPFIAMELLEGQTLAWAIAARPLPIETVLLLGSQICDALQFAHERGIIHRDLKPSNVFVTSRGDAKILDFGLAKDISAETASATVTTLTAPFTTPGQLLGTVAYMSPEQAQGKAMDSRSDLFSLGAVLYEMATGHRAFAEDSSAAILAEILRGQPVPIRTLNPKLPPDLQSIVAKALEKNPADRYQSAKELMVDLRRLSKHLTNSEMGGGSVRRSILRTNLFRYGIASSLIAIAVGVAIVLTPSSTTGPLDSTQLTFSAQPKDAPLFTDGTRLYFQSRGEPSEMAASGGVIAPMKVLEPGMDLLDISADASKVLALQPALNDEIRRGTLWEAPMFGGTPRKLTDHLAQAAAWAPDGRSIAFMDRTSLFICDSDGTNERKIWDAPGYSYHMSFSPDGASLSVTIDSSPAWRLWSLKVDGSNPHPLPLDWPAKANEWGGQWTPDGRHFVFLSDREGRENAYELITPPWYEFWKKPSAVRITGNQLEIEALAPARDAKGIFVLGRLEQGAMEALDPQEKKFTPFLQGLSALQLIISPDRQWMAYTAYPTMQLWKSRLDGTDPVQLTDAPAYMEQWSPDGKWIAYMDWKKISIVSVDGGAPVAIPPSGGNQVAPSWSPDGKALFFNNFPYPGQPIKGIQVLDLATRMISLMPGSAGYYVPSWSPDGKYLVAMAQNPSRMVLYSAETKKWKDLKQFDFDWGYWVWASDSKSIYMAPTLQNPGIYQLTIADGKWAKISGMDGITLRGLAGDTFLSLTADGKPALMSDTSVSQIYSLRWKE
jgi:serine/threonine protein kinase/Tol biopolymer transport system component